MKITRLNQASGWLWELGKLKVLVDPWLMGEAVFYHQGMLKFPLPGDVVDVDDIGRIDLIIISSHHADHCHLPTLALFGKNTSIVAPKKAVQKLKRAGFLHVRALESGILGQGGLDVCGLRLFMTSMRSAHYREFLRALVIHCNETGENILYAPHGAHWDERLQHQLHVEQIDGFDVLFTTCRYYKMPFLLGGEGQLGLKKAQALYDFIKPRVFIGNHNQPFDTKGVLANFRLAEKKARVSDLRVDETCEVYDPAVGEIIRIVEECQ